jgi:outer membrane protein assembly factor BamA
MKIKISLLLLIIFCSKNIFAQQEIKDTTNKKLVASKDMSDVIKNIFKKHEHQNDKVVKEKKYYLTYLPAAGYSLQTGLAVAANASLAFYTDTSARKRLSNINTSMTYTQYSQFLFPISANIWARKNDLNIIVDYRFLKYPSTNYGIGARTSEDDAYTLNYNYIKLHQTILKRIYKELYGGVGFYYDYFWNISEVDPPIGTKTSFQRYGPNNKEVSSGIAFRLTYDNRDNQIHASKGSLANIIFRPNFTFMGSDANWKSLQFEYRKYIKLSSHSNNALALWSYNWFTIGKQKPPYLLLPSTAWDDQYNTGRGYIQGRYRAKNMLYAEAEYRFGITHNGLLGGVVFANAQSYSKNLSNELSVIAPAVGFGLRVKLNKNSNTNLCIDYGFGQNGSKGLFLNLGEVF